MKIYHGFTLIELLASLSVVSIIAAFGVPSFNHLYAKTQSNKDIAAIIDILQLGRATAVIENRTMTVCTTDDRVQCNRDASKTIAVFRDDDENRKIGDDELSYMFTMTDGAVLSLRVSGGRNFLRFKGSGALKEFGRIRYCPSDDDARKARELVLNILGRIRFASDLNGDGIVEYKHGDNISCNDNLAT